MLRHMEHLIFDELYTFLFIEKLSVICAPIVHLHADHENVDESTRPSDTVEVP
jgi:hypothetical protein